MAVRTLEWISSASGNLVAARVVAGTGDWETFPTRDEFESDLETTQMSNIDRVKLNALMADIFRRSPTRRARRSASAGFDHPRIVNR
jgi:hypothetical protein